MKELPDDLAAMGTADIAEQRAVRDDHLAQLFQRWPALSQLELGQLRRIYSERLRIAKFVGRVRARRVPH
jgi:hypothetical protein